MGAQDREAAAGEIIPEILGRKRTVSYKDGLYFAILQVGFFSRKFPNCGKPSKVARASSSGPAPHGLNIVANIGTPDQDGLVTFEGPRVNANAN